MPHGRALGFFATPRPFATTNVLSGTAFTTGDVTIKINQSPGATVIVGSQVGNTVQL
jgi:hypothetical protein